MLSSQAVIDAERPGLGVGEGAVDPGQNDMGGHGADDMGLVPDVGGAGVGRGQPSVLIVAPGATLAATKPCSEAAEKSLIAARRRRPGASFSTLGARRLSRTAKTAPPELPRRIRVPLQPTPNPPRRLKLPSRNRHRPQAANLQHVDHAGSSGISLPYRMVLVIHTSG